MIEIEECRGGALTRPVFCKAKYIRRQAKRRLFLRNNRKSAIFGGRVDAPPLQWGMQENKYKNPRSHWLQGRIVDPRYHPACPFGGATSGSSKPYPGNGGNRVPLLRPCPFTGPTQEPDLRAQSTGSHRPPALWSMETGRIFPSMSFRCIQLTLKHKQTGLSTSLR